MAYSVKIGIAKSFKNTFAVFGPAILAALLAFAAAMPPEYQAIAGVVAGFIGQFIKNYLANKDVE